MRGAKPRGRDCLAVHSSISLYVISYRPLVLFRRGENHLRSRLVVAVGIERLQDIDAVAVALLARAFVKAQPLDAQFGAVEHLLAAARQSHTFLIQAEGCFERKLAACECVAGLVEAAKRLLEGQWLVLRR